jgi:DNA-binding transcriptional ArsR family regulator
VTAAAVCSRRVSAGIVPDPAAAAEKRHRHPRHPLILRWAAAPAPAWWGREDWLREVEDALTPEVCREFSVSRDTALAVAREHAKHADHRTGRGCRPTNARLLELARVSLSTVQRARRALEALGLIRRQVEGRSVMSRAERLEAWRRGSSWRTVAAEFALCSLRRSAPRRQPRTVGEKITSLRADLRSVDGDTPPGAERSELVSHLPRLSPRRGTETKIGAPRRAHTGKGGTAAGRRLAEDVGRRLRWLQATHWRRMAPTLTRFARAGWTVRDVELAVRDALAARGWRLPPRLDHPAAYLARLLRELDPEDRPSVELDRHAAEVAAAAAERRATERRWHDALRGTCAHGVPAGDVPHPLTGSLACLTCRRSSRGDGSRNIDR